MENFDKHPPDRGRSARSGVPWRRLLATGCGLLFAALVVWQLVLPPALGGRTALVVASGASMEPSIGKGDLVVVRRSSVESLGRGDVILYRSPTLNRWVLHRIIKTEPGGRFVTKGDNNSFLDSDRPGRGDVIGVKAFSITGGGNLAGSHTTQVLTALIGLVSLGMWALVSFGLNRRRPTEQVPEQNEVLGVDRDSEVDATLEVSVARQGMPRHRARIVAAISIGLISLAGCMALWMKATEKRPPVEMQVSGPRLDGAYTHTGRLSYTAVERSKAIQTDGKATTGDALFVDTSGPVSVTFSYKLEGAGAQDVEGAAKLTVLVNDAAGWSFEDVLAEAEVEGGKVQLDGVLDLRQLRKRVDAFESASKTVPPQYNVRIEPLITLDERAPSPVRNGVFDGGVDFVLDQRRLRPALIDGGDAGSQFEPAKTIESTSGNKANAARTARRIPRNVYRALAIALLMGGMLCAALLLPGRASSKEWDEESEDALPRQEPSRMSSDAPDQPTVALEIAPLLPPEPERDPAPTLMPTPTQRPRQWEQCDVEEALERVEAFVVTVPRIRIAPGETLVHIQDPHELAAAVRRSTQPVVCERGAHGIRWAVRLGETCLLLTLLTAHSDREAA